MLDPSLFLESRAKPQPPGSSHGVFKTEGALMKTASSLKMVVVSLKFLPPQRAPQKRQ